MVVDLYWDKAISPIMTLCVLGAESSLGDPKLGGELITGGSHNYGCIHYMGTETPWGALSSGKMTVRGIDWYKWPTPEVGMEAWGLYIKHGPSWKPGYYMSVYPNWVEFSVVYYGAEVEGFQDYVHHLQELDGKFRRGLRSAGFNID